MNSTQVPQIDEQFAPADPYDPMSWMASVRDCMNHTGIAEVMGHVLGGAEEALQRIVDEHAGMSDELLCVYEQMGMLFELTRALPHVQSETEVVDIFVERLRQSFPSLSVQSAISLGHGSSGCTGICPDSFVQNIIELASRERRVVVEPLSGNQSSDPGADEAGVEIMVGPVFSGDRFVGAVNLTRTPHSAVFRSIDMQLVDALTTFLGDVIRNLELVHEIRQTSIAMVRTLVNAVDQRDEYTSGHSLRVGYYAKLLAERIGLEGNELQMLQWSALMHDVGKIGIRDDVLKKVGKLTDEEFEHIKEHPVRGFQIVRAVPQLASALPGVLYHHEHWNGGGYPAGLKDESIPLQARIVQIADVFDALTSNRSYRKAFTWQKALDILSADAGRIVDPTLQVTFDQMMREILEEGPGAWDQLLDRAEGFWNVRGRGHRELEAQAS